MIILFVLFVIGLAFAVVLNYHEDAPVWMVLVFIFDMVIFLVCLMSMANKRKDGREALEDYKLLQPYVRLLNEQNDELLRLASLVMLSERIDKVNTEIKLAKAANGGLFDIWIVDDLVDLEPIDVRAE